MLKEYKVQPRLKDKVLMVGATASMIRHFNQRNIKILQELGYEVHVATNMIKIGSMSPEENERFKEWMKDNDVIAHQVDFERRLGTIKGNILAIRQLKQLFKDNDYKFIHVHSPLGSILGRYVAWRFKVPAIYTAHGFHFFKGGPKSGWLIFFPIEWLFSFLTDTLITINDEDFDLAKKYMHATKVLQINGIGIDIEKAWTVSEEYKQEARKKIRNELGIPNDAVLLSSVGELSKRKNHKIVLEALRILDPEEREKIYYVIAGVGSGKEALIDQAKSFNYENHLKLLGYRTDIHDINFASDASIFPSLQEGLGIAGLDATVDGTFLIGSNKRGIADYIKDGKNGIVFDGSPLSLAQIIRNRKFAVSDISFLKKFDKKSIDKKMEKYYSNM
ncbi:glycosyltransferase [Leuconostoc lactis]|uniref:glycosyltransferase n=1 Tax=Leuconostoc lactis TaxID=1246 RepID=UPI0037460C34